MRHRLERETPLAIYVGLKLHAETRKRELVEKLFQLGVSILYDRVLQISTECVPAVQIGTGCVSTKTKAELVYYICC